MKLILVVRIDQLSNSTYKATSLCLDQEVTTPDVYHRIGTAIRETVLSVPEGFAHFVEIRYEEFTSGTYLLGEVEKHAEAIADRLVALVRERHLIAEHARDRLSSVTSQPADIPAVEQRSE